MSLLLDLTGQRFTRLVAQSFVREGKRTYWNCLCDCGKPHRIESRHLRSGRGKSCGCLMAELSGARNASHRMTGTRVYRSWASMLQRCYRVTDTAYARYGGRGITVCERWRHSFENFLADMGEPPSPKHTLDRCENSGNYEPGNCRWATKKEQARNTRRNVRYEVDGISLTLPEWSERNGVPLVTIRKRLQAGRPIRVAVSKTALYGRPPAPRP